jgi:DNA-directed RNA polymerase beta subunit
MRQYYGKLVKEIRLSSRATSGIVGRATSELYQIDEHRKIIKSSTIESGMKSALMTGNWGSRTPRKSQVLNRITYCATLSHLRRVSTNIDKNSKLIQPRSSTALSGRLLVRRKLQRGTMWDFVKNMSIERS